MGERARAASPDGVCPILGDDVRSPLALLGLPGHRTPCSGLQEVNGLDADASCEKPPQVNASPADSETPRPVDVD